MKYNLKNTAELAKAMDYIDQLALQEKVVEIKKVVPGRSNPQNRYLHLIIAAFGNHFGWTLSEAKELYKHINNNIYRYEKQGAVFYRSSADLTIEEMTASIDRFREYSEQQGYPLPLATDEAWLQEIDNEIERSNYKLR